MNMDEDTSKIKTIQAFTIIILISMPLDSIWCYYEYCKYKSRL